MRIIILHSRYLSGSASGENRVVEDESRLLVESGHVVHSWTPSLHDSRGVRLAHAAVDAIWAHGAVTHVASLVRKFKPDVVHVHNVFPALSPAIMRATRPAALVATLHNYRLACLPGTLFRDGLLCTDCVGRLPLPGIRHACYRNSRSASGTLSTSIGLHRAIGTFDRVDLYCAVSDFVRRQHIQFGIAADRIIVKRNFAWPSPRRDGSGEYFLYAGRLAPEKGLDTLIQAFDRVPARLLVVGEGPEEPHLRMLSGPNVEFRSTVPGRDMMRIAASARAILLPSRWYEPGPRSAIEAFAAGIPVVASRIGGLPELVDDGKTGLLVPPGDTSAWVSALIRLLDDDVNVAMGRRAHGVWASRFSPQAGLNGLEQAYERARSRSQASQ